MRSFPETRLAQVLKAFFQRGRKQLVEVQEALGRTQALCLSDIRKAFDRGLQGLGMLRHGEIVAELCQVPDGCDPRIEGECAREERSDQTDAYEDLELLHTASLWATCLDWERGW